MGELEREPPARRLLTYKQACVVLGDISLPTLHRLIRAGEITPLKLTAQTRRISPADLDAYIRRLEAAQGLAASCVPLR